MDEITAKLRKIVKNGRSSREFNFEFQWIVVGILKAQIDGLNILDFYVGRYDKTIDDIVLEVVFRSMDIWFIQRPASRCGRIREACEILTKFICVDKSRCPEVVRLLRVRGEVDI